MDPKTDFDFYLKCTKSLVLSLPRINDRILSAAWIKRIIDDNEASEKIKTDCLKLLLFILQKRQLYQPFNIHPDNYGSLEEIQKWDLQSIADIIFKEEIRDANKTFGPEYTTDCSGNLQEYIAAQEIPRFGTHVYYAFSNSPLPQWDRVEKGTFPKPMKLEIPEKDTNATTNDDDKTSQSQSQSQLQSESTKNSLGEESKPVKKPIFIAFPPNVRIGSLPSRDNDERLPPIWGSSLYEVKKNV